MMRHAVLVAAVLSCSVSMSRPASAETPRAGTGADGFTASPAPRPASQPSRSSGPLRDAVEPDFTVVTLPTTRRLPSHRFAFRLTHRFSRPLGQGDFGDLASDLFGLDSAANIGLELRFGMSRQGQVGVYRTNDKTLQLFGQHGLLRQGGSVPVTLDAVVSIEGLNNFREHYSTGVGVAMSRRLGSVATLYAHPMWIANTNLVPGSADDDDTFVVGVGTRLRIRPTVYVVGEVVARAAGYAPGEYPVAFGIEKRAGGHLFQLNFSNSLGTTFGQLARGARSHDDWFIGFNVTRKFF